jgi:hypothetical protein
MTLHHRRSTAAVLSALAGAAVLSAHPAAATPLPRTHLVLPSAIAVDDAAGIVTLPLHRGTAAGKTVWYIVTDSSSAADARNRKANLAPLLANLGDGCSGCVRDAVETNGSIAFPGAPNFAPTRGYVASATGFPPTSAAPGATADATYTPFVRIGGAVVNAPIVATGDGPFDVTTHANTQDRVVAIDTAKHTVTLALAKGFFNGKRVDYISTEASDPGAAAIERATYVPALAAKAGIVPIDVVANGTKQGLGFVALHGNLALDATLANAATLGSAMNVLSTFPSAAAYSPLWDVDVVAWKPAVLAAHGDRVLTGTADLAAASAAVTGADGKAIGRAGFVVNCPVVAYVDAP